MAALIGSAVLMFYIAPKHGRQNVFVYCSICSVIGSLTVMATKVKHFSGPLMNIFIRRILEGFDMSCLPELGVSRQYDGL